MAETNWRCPDSKLILPAGAPRDEWLAARREGIGGSDVSAILGFNPHKSAYGVWLEKTGRETGELEETPAMRWGKLHEPAMRKVFTEDTGIALRLTGLHRSKKYPHLQVTPDGLTGDGGVFESKTANWRVFKEDWDDDEVADHAALQVCHSMGVTGRARAHVMALSEGYIHRFYTIERDQSMIDAVCAHLENWWESYVIKDVEPPMTPGALTDVKDHLRISMGTEVTIADPTPVWQKIAMLKAHKEDAAEAEGRAAEIEAQLRVLAGEAGVLKDLDGKVLYTLNNDGTFSPKRFATLLTPDQLEGVTHLVEALNMDKVKTKYPEEYRKCRARVLRPKKQEEAK